MRASSPPPGAIAFGESGSGYPLVRIEGNRWILQGPSGLIRVPAHAVVRWLPPITIGAHVKISRPGHFGHDMKGTVIAEFRNYFWVQLDNLRYGECGPFQAQHIIPTQPHGVS